MGGYLGQLGDGGAISVQAAINGEENQCGEVVKSQTLRLSDAIVLAPFLGYLAWKGNLSPFERWTLATVAGATAYFNVRNWLANRD